MSSAAGLCSVASSKAWPGALYRMRSGAILCSGNIVMDILVRPVDRIEWNATTWVNSIEQHLGGNGANTACTIGILGTRVRLISMVGLDAFGDFLMARLTAAGVGVSGVQRSSAPTATTVGLVDSAGNRLFLHQVG